jgi:hypothetical protein
LSSRIKGSWNNNGIDWSDFEEQTIRCVLNFFYTGDYYTSHPGCDPTGSGENAASDGNDCEISLPDRREAYTHRTMTGSGCDVGEVQDIIVDRPLTPMDQCVLAGPLPEKMDTVAGLFGQSMKGNNTKIPAEIFAHAKVYSFAHSI